MDFERVLQLVIGFFEERELPYALIGGLCMAAFGMARTTLDVDLVAPGDAQDRVVDFLEEQGYRTAHVSSGYSNHVHHEKDMGSIDVVYVRGDTSSELFGARRWIDGPGGRKVSVLRPEHLAAMKVFAIKNDPSRAFRELGDIQFLLSLDDVDRNEIREYFEKHGLGEHYEALEKIL